MEWRLSADRPIFQQLYEQLERRIVTGVYLPGERIPSVRELAAEAGVNPNTMQRALSQLESAGLVETNRTAGRVVSADGDRIDVLRRELLKRAAGDYLSEALALGCTAGEAAELVLKEGEKNNG